MRDARAAGKGRFMSLGNVRFLEEVMCYEGCGMSNVFY